MSSDNQPSNTPALVALENARSLAANLQLWLNALRPEEKANLQPINYSASMEANFLLGLRERVFSPKGLVLAANILCQAKRPLAVRAILSSGQLGNEGDYSNVNARYQETLGTRQPDTLHTGDILLLDRGAPVYDSGEPDAKIIGKLPLATVIEVEDSNGKHLIRSWETGQYHYVVLDPYNGDDLQQEFVRLRVEAERAAEASRQTRVHAVEGLQATIDQLNQAEEAAIPYSQSFERNFLIAMRENALPEAAILKGLKVLNGSQRLQGLFMAMRHCGTSKEGFLKVRDYTRQLLAELPPLPKPQKYREGDIMSFTVKKPIFEVSDTVTQKIGELAPETVILLDVIHNPQWVSATNLETGEKIVLQI